MPTSYSAQDMGIALDDLKANVTALAASHASDQRLLADIASSLQGISHMLTREYLLPDVLYSAEMTPSDTKLNRNGRHYILIFTPVAIANVTAKVLGIGGYTFTLNAGWNNLEFPDGTVLNGPTGGTQQVIIKITNWTQAGAL